MVQAWEIVELLRNPNYKELLRQYGVFVLAGLFSRNHRGLQFIPPAMLKAVNEIRLEDIPQVVKTYNVLLAIASQSYRKGQIAECVTGVDEAHTFSYGVMMIMDIRRWEPPQPGLDQLKLLHPNFVDTVEGLAQQGLTQEIAESALRQSDRMNRIVIWPDWIKDLLPAAPPSN